MGSPLKTSAKDQLDELYFEYRGCEECPICEDRSAQVIGRGRPETSVVFISDKPSFSDGRSGKILSGDSGALLESMLEHGLSKNLDNYWSTPAVLCLSNDGATPKKVSIDACRIRLHREIDIVRPRVLVALGTLALKALFSKNTPAVTSNAGRVIDAHIRGIHVEYAIPTMVTYSPGFLLRNPDNSPDGLWNKFFTHVSRAIALADTLRDMEQACQQQQK